MKINYYHWLPKKNNNNNNNESNLFNETWQLIEKTKSFSSFSMLTFRLIEGSLHQFERPFFWTDASILDEKMVHLQSIEGNIKIFVQICEKIESQMIESFEQLDSVKSKDRSCFVNCIKWISKKFPLFAFVDSSSLLMMNFVHDDQDIAMIQIDSHMKSIHSLLNDILILVQKMILNCYMKDYQQSSWLTIVQKLIPLNHDLLRTSETALQQLRNISVVDIVSQSGNRIIV